MRRPDLDISWLRGFLAVADAGSIAAAAADLSLGEAEVTERLRRIEESLGRPLFIYGTAGLRLTPDGGRLIDNARRLVALHDDAVACVIGEADGTPACRGADHEVMPGGCEAVRMRELLADAIGCVSEGFVLFDDQGRLVVCNERYRGAYPLLADLLRPGVRFAELLHKAVERGAAGSELDDPSGWIAERLLRHTRGGPPSDHRLADGRWYRISEHATRSGGVVKILTDITELKRHEEALAESEARYRRLVEVAPYGIVVWDGARVRFANRAASRILGTADEAAMAGVPRVEGGERLFARLPPPGRGAAPDGPVEAHVAVADGAPRDLEVGVHAFAVDGEPAWFLVLDDVTQRKQAERALQQAQKMQAIGQLAGGIAHEFNNMLTAIGGFALMARRTPGDQPRVAQCLTEIVKATERAAGLTGQLLSFGRAGRPEAAKPVRVAAQLDDLRRFLRPILGERYAVTAEVRDPDAVVLIEPALLHQTLVNLAINGRDAMPNGGRIAVTVGRAEADAAFLARHPDLRPGAYVTVTVRDDGQGIAPEVLDRIFEPFFTTKEPGEGTGLGLSLVYSTVTRAGGAVEVETEPGQGAAFTLWLPAHGAGVADDLFDLDAADGEEGLSMAASVLLVEDEEQVRDFIRLTLEDMGMRVFCAGDGTEALEAFKAHAGAFDLLVTDLVMPRMGGAETARTLRRENPDLPIVLISGYPPEKENLDDLLADVRRVVFLHKPINPDELADKVHALVV